MTNSEQRGFLDGEPGECLFIKPFHLWFRENEFPALLKKVEGVSDDRLLAVVTALIVENRLEACLRAFMPRFERLVTDNEVTLSAKIRILEALNFVPLLVTEEAHLLRKIRNEFAHNLDIRTFDELESKLSRQLRDVGRRAFPFQAEAIPGSLGEAFRRASFHCIVSLDIYCGNIEALRASVQDAGFLQDLENRLRAESDRKLAAITSNQPESIERQGSLLVTRYSGGVVVVSTIPEGSEGEPSQEIAAPNAEK